MAGKKHLVIIESPGKRAKIQKYLGSDYIVVPSYGHVIDLPQKELGVDVKNGFKPTYEILPDKKDVVKGIVDQAKKSDIVYLFTDMDREGSGIAYHIASQLPSGIPYKRGVYGEISEKAIKKAVTEAGDIDMNMVAAYECRRILDRLVGFKCSFITKQATGGISAGRVQSATLRFLAEREAEIKAFVPETYFDIDAEIITKAFEKVLAKIKTPDKLDIKTQASAEDICEKFRKGPVVVSKFEKKTASTKPYPPFTTSTLQQAASTYFSWPPKKTMQVAQKLYEDGLISYMRTDSKFIAPEFIQGSREMCIEDFGQKYVPSKPIHYANAGNAQEAHEAIRPIDLSVRHASTGDEHKLYDMIWRRTVSSQMTEAEYIKSYGEFSAGKYVLAASGSKCTFDGWRKVWTYGGSDDAYMPELKEGEEVKVTEIKWSEKQTQPPSRYSEASCVKKMESLGIGRPSTFANTIATLVARKYIETKKNTIHVTDMGMRVTEFLVNSNFCFVDLNFTAEMEQKLDVSQSIDKVAILTEFWTRLKSDLVNAKTTKESAGLTDYDCPDCGSKLKIKHGKYGDFLGCSNYPDCKKIMKIDEDGKPAEIQKTKVESSNIECPNCGKKLVIRTSKKTGSQFLGCVNWQDKKCAGIYTMEGEKIENKKKSFKKPFKKRKDDESEND